LFERRTATGQQSPLRLCLVKGLPIAPDVLENVLNPVRAETALGYNSQFRSSKLRKKVCASFLRSRVAISLKRVDHGPWGVAHISGLKHLLTFCNSRFFVNAAVSNEQAIVDRANFVLAAAEPAGGEK